jgi:protein phosphatase PTC2/3
LDGPGVENSNAFFAVYDGHGGTFQKVSSHLKFLYCHLGQKMSKFAAITVHKKLVTEEAYHEGHYEEALKKAFLDTDKAFLAGQFCIFLSVEFLTSKP